MAESTCKIQDCDKPVRARGMCGGHYRRWSLGQPVNVPLTRQGVPNAPCSADGCDEPWKSRGLCRRHYDGWLRARPREGRPCRIASCDGTVRAKDLCQFHYGRLLDGRDLEAPRGKIYTPEGERWCIVEGCDRKSEALRMCMKHYQRTRTHGDPFMYHGRSRGPHNLCEVEGCPEQQKFKGMCRRHYERKRTGCPLDGPVFARRYVDSRNGYVYVVPPEGHPYRGGGRRVAEHRIVMERILGRQLLRSESVHHKNGNRSDNRPDNLELWISHQPSGQRPEDLLAWADEINALYGHMRQPRAA